MAKKSEIPKAFRIKRRGGKAPKSIKVPFEPRLPIKGRKRPPRKRSSTLPFGMRWTRGPLGETRDFLSTARKPAAAKAVPKPVNRVTWTGRPLRINTGRVRERLGLPEQKKAKERWRESLKKPEDFKRFTETNLPPGVEAIIDLDVSGIYYLNRATEKLPDHLNDEMHTCQHPSNASSWVATIGLVALESGELGLLGVFWDGGVIAYYWKDSDDTLWFYKWWREQRSKGKAIKGREGPSVLWSQPYVRLV
jgi:hypothetical protein